MTPDELPVSPDASKDAAPDLTGRTEAAPIRLDSDLGYLLHRLGAAGAKPLAGLGVEEARAQRTLGEVAQDIAPLADPSVVLEIKSIEAGHSTLELRIYRPRPAIGGPLPGLIWFGDGLFLLGRGEALDGVATGLAHRTGAVVICPLVRQAPEHRFPAAHVDALAVWRHLPELAADLAIDPFRLALGGEGAGGNLALHIALEARGSDMAQPLHLVLADPWTNLAAQPPGDAENGQPGILSDADLLWAAKKLVRKRVDLHEPRLNPGARIDLKGLPPTTVILAEHGPLAVHGEALADQMRREGMWVDVMIATGMVHGFLGLNRVVNKAMLAQGRIARNLRVAFESVLSRRARQI